MVDVKLPDLGEGTKEATIKEVLVKVGQRVDEYEDLCEVFTDKLVAKIPSTAAGIVREINFQDDTICKVGHPILVIEADDDQAPAAEKQPSSSSDDSDSSSSSSSSSDDEYSSVDKAEATVYNKYSTPAVRAMIQRKGLDINKISASGRNGRVLKEDVLKYIESGKHEQDKKQIKEQPMQPVQKPDAQSSFSSSHKIAKLTGIKDTDKVV